MIAYEAEGFNHKIDNWAPQVSQNSDLLGSTEQVHPLFSFNDYSGTGLYTSSNINDNTEPLQ